MMIELRLTADTPSELHGQLIAILAGSTEAATPNPPQAAPKATRGKKNEPAAGDAGSTSGSDPAGSQPTAPAADPASSTAATSPAAGSSAAADTGPVTRDTISEKAMKLAQIGGPGAIASLWGEFGATKFSDITEDKYAGLNVRLDELLTPAS